jgi:asparagine synthase (glutamine-hydrolysing)
MCGILGLVGSACDNLDERTFIDALDLLHHRGPDSGAIWQDRGARLGHRRLSIVDLDQRANQPMLLGDLVLVFNGEIYNHCELRTELQALGQCFVTTSDSEVLLHAWMQWGHNCLLRLEGMFAFAMWNRRTRRLTLARDRFGEKPLFVHRHAHGLAFASEMPPLIRLANGELIEDTAAIGLFFLYSYIPAPYGAFENVFQLEQGCWLEWSAAEGITHGQYYDLHTTVALATQAPQPDYAVAVSQLRDRLTDAVRLRLETTDVPVATLLSGGIDSSIITMLAARTNSQTLAAYSLGFPEDPDFDETSYSRAVAETLPNVQHHVVEATQTRILDFASKVLDRLGEPFADASILPTSLLCSQVNEKVVLGGDAADELFTGYGAYPAILRGTTLPAPLRSLLRIIPPHSNPPSIRQSTLRAAALFHHHLRDDPLDAYLSWRTYAKPATLVELGIDCSANADVRNRINNKFTGSLRDLQTMDIAFNLSNDMLKKVDYASMVHGLEVRSPFLDSQLVHWALALPDSFRFSDGVRKRILRDAFASNLPQRVLTRGKMGFLLPIRQWFRNGRLRNELEELLDEQTRFKRKSVEWLIADHAAGAADHSVLLWSLYVYLRWRGRLNLWATHAATESKRALIVRYYA